MLASIRLRAWLRAIVLGIACGAGVSAEAQPLVPGTGKQVKNVGDDFENPEWKFVANLPKVYNKEDEILASNFPHGRSKNNRWLEGPMRGQPDIVKRVETPPDGLPGSEGALLLKSLRTGYARRPVFDAQQDDLIASVADRFGKTPCAKAPSVVTRVWLPPKDEWENRTGAHFGFRLSLESHFQKQSESDKKKNKNPAQYWPGLFIDFHSKEGIGATGQKHDRVMLRVRANSTGHDMMAREMKTMGWWTLGMSVTPDGMVHYYAKPGVEDLTSKDYITSQMPYSKQAIWFETFFFNICSADDNKTWSTEFIIDDTRMYLAK